MVANLILKIKKQVLEIYMQKKHRYKYFTLHMASIFSKRFAIWTTGT